MQTTIRKVLESLPFESRDWISDDIRARRGWPTFWEALVQVHNPREWATVAWVGVSSIDIRGYGFGADDAGPPSGRHRSSRVHKPREWHRSVGREW